MHRVGLRRRAALPGVADATLQRFIRLPPDVPRDQRVASRGRERSDPQRALRSTTQAAGPRHSRARRRGERARRAPSRDTYRPGHRARRGHPRGLCRRRVAVRLRELDRRSQPSRRPGPRGPALLRGSGRGRGGQPSRVRGAPGAWRARALRDLGVPLRARRDCRRRRADPHRGGRRRRVGPDRGADACR